MNKNPRLEKENNLVKSLEGIGDILVFETKRLKNDIVLNGLENIHSFIKKLFHIQLTNPEQFDELITSSEYKEIYSNNIEKARMHLSFKPDKYLKGFSTPINQILRIYEAAVQIKNEEASRASIKYIILILIVVSSQKNNELFISNLLTKLFYIVKTAISHNDKTAEIAATQWYTNVVFPIIEKQEYNFNIIYLDLFNSGLFSIIKYIVTEGQTHIFHYMVSHLIIGIHMPSYNKGKVWDYGHLLLRTDFEKYKQLDDKNILENRIRVLSASENDIYNMEQLNAWLEKFNELKDFLTPHFDDKLKDEAKTIEQKIRNFVLSQYKYKELLEISFAIGAYCLFKKRYDYIVYLWEYKQPPDSDAQWVGHDINPNSLDEIINLFYRKCSVERKYDFWEDHHGSEIYYKKYFLLLLAKVLNAADTYPFGIHAHIENYKLPAMHIHILSNIKDSIDDLVELASQLKSNDEVLHGVGFDISTIDDLVNTRLISFLNKINQEASTQIATKQRTGKISIKKIEEFKDKVIDKFHEEALLRNIFKHFNNYDNEFVNNEQNKSRIVRVGLNVIVEKAYFFDEWYVHYLGWGEDFGSNLAVQENMTLLKKISENSIEVKETSIEEILFEFDNPANAFIVATHGSYGDIFLESKRFRPKWHKGIEQIDIQGFGGWYEYADQLIPVFELFLPRKEDKVIILNREKLGKLIQLLPLNDNELEQGKLIQDGFCFNITAFSDNPELIENYISKPPEWLKKYESAEEMREYLESRVLIDIYEKIKYIQHDNFQGYKLAK